MLNHLNETTT